MKIEMPKLAYATTALEPVISEQTINFHYGKHLQNYVNTLGSLVKDTEWEGKSVEEIVEGAPEGPLFNNAGQVLNHALYFDQFRAPRQNNLPTGKILDAINDTFGSFDNFKAQFTQAATTLFGSGWAWLSQRTANSLSLRKQTAAIHCAKALHLSMDLTCGNMLITLISRTDALIISLQVGTL